MSIQSVEITLGLTPRSRFDIIDVVPRISDQYGDLLQNYPKITCCSFHTTVGYLHDSVELREELSESEKEREPLNADSHLTFMSAGLKNCVTYANRPKLPIYFIDLDGIYKHHRRNRRTTVLAYNNEEVHKSSYPYTYILNWGRQL